MAVQPFPNQLLVARETVAATTPTTIANIYPTATIIPAISTATAEKVGPDASPWLYIGLGDSDVRSLQTMGLVFASISLVATCLSVYWLVRMHRGFRHE